MKRKGGIWPLRTPSPRGPLGWSHWMCLIMRNRNIYGLWVGNWTISEILGLLWSGGMGHGHSAPRGTLWHPPANLLFKSYHIPQISEKSVARLLKKIYRKKLGRILHASKGRSVSAVLNCETLLQTPYTYISHPKISEQSIHWLLRNRPDKNLAERKIRSRRWRRRRRRRNAVKPISLPTSFGRLNKSMSISLFTICIVTFHFVTAI